MQPSARWVIDLKSPTAALAVVEGGAHGFLTIRYHDTTLGTAMRRSKEIVDVDISIFWAAGALLMIHTNDTIAAAQIPQSTCVAGMVEMHSQVLSC